MTLKSAATLPAASPLRHNMRVATMASRARPRTRRARPSAVAANQVATTACVHYARNCNLVAPCCNNVVCCHVGHDTNKICSAALDRTKVTTIVCCSCKQPQSIAAACRYCGRTFAEKACIVCKLWYSGDAYHCSSCGVCRRGRPDQVRHCTVCNVCYPLDGTAKPHICSPDTTARLCVGCNTEMKNSRSPVVTMRCGHAMHTHCFLHRVRSNFSCPRRDCRKVVADIQSWYDALDHTPNAPSMSPPTTVSCVDCRAITQAQPLGFYARCAVCRSMNTVRVPPGLPFALPPRTVRQ